MAYNPTTEPFDFLESVMPWRHVRTDRPIVASVSGGASSALMVLLLENNPAYKGVDKYYVFANTGREVTDTLVFLRNFARWQQIHVGLIEALVFPDERKSSGHTIKTFQTLSTEGEPFEQMVEKYGLPNVSFPHCSRELKINPIKSYIRDTLGFSKGEFVEAVGYRYDEAKRISPSRDAIYPLFDFGINKQDVIAFWEHPTVNRYALGIEEFEGNCDLCFKKSWPKLKQMAAKDASTVLWWNDLERKHQKGADDHIYRGQRSAHDLMRDLPRNAEADVDLACACDKSEE